MIAMDEEYRSAELSQGRVFAAVLLAVVLMTSPLWAAPPRPISEAERRAVALALSYFEAGEVAWWDQLTTDAPLRSLAREDALAEIAVRLGPRQDVTWKLCTPAAQRASTTAVFALDFPSGADEIIELELVPHDGYRIRHLRTLADEAPIRKILADDRGPVDRSFLRLASLRSLRETLTGGSISPRMIPAAGNPKLYRVEQLWLLQGYLLEHKMGKANEILHELDPSRFPLDSLLRARYQVLQGTPGSTQNAYNIAVAHVIDNDCTRLEAAEAYLMSNLVDDAETELRFSVRMGTRLAESHYFLSQIDFFQDQGTDAEKAFRTAWKLRPKAREDLFANPFLAGVAARPNILAIIRLHESHEPVIHATDERRPLAELTDKSQALLGRELDVRVGDPKTSRSRILIPGGAALAPDSTPQEDAVSRARREEEEAMVLIQRGGQGVRTLRRPEVILIAEALGRQNRWRELVDLTAGLKAQVEHLDPDLVQWHALALTRLGREAEARRILIRLGQAAITHHRRDPATFFQLGELMSKAGEYDLAIRLLERADQLSPGPYGKFRRRQLEMQKDLVADNYIHETAHLEIRYPRSAEARYAISVGTVLEAEYERLRTWIPVRPRQKIGIDLFPLRQFMASYSVGVAVLGVYDGRVRVPFADVESLNSTIVSVLSHELAHAMITEYTDDQAPRWFQEGLAQHVEMADGAMNPMPDLVARKRYVSFPLIESVLAGFSEPQLVDLAYNETAWVLHFVEEKFGVRGIRRLLDAYAAGKETEAAIRSALGVSQVAFEEDAWDWSANRAARAWKSAEVRRYDKNYSAYVTKSSVAEQLPYKKEIRTLGHVEPPKTGPTPQELMTAWYATYEEHARPIKVVLAAVVPTFRTGETRDGVEDSCRDLEHRIDKMFAAKAVLDPPDDLLSWHLRRAYQRFRLLAKACLQSKYAEARAHIDHAEDHLKDAAFDLSKYGLEP